VREPRKVAAEAVKNVIKNFCRGSLEELLTGLVDHQVIDSAELRRLSARIEAEDRAKRESDAKREPDRAKPQDKRRKKS
jgi:predicted transcriptional regulator